MSVGNVRRGVPVNAFYHRPAKNVKGRDIKSATSSVLAKRCKDANTRNATAIRQAHDLRGVHYVNHINDSVIANVCRQTGIAKNDTPE